MSEVPIQPKFQMMQTEPPHSQPQLSSSPSFSSYSSETLAQIAARVIQELSLHDDALFDDENDNFTTQPNDTPNQNDDDDDDDFEFAFVSRDSYSSPVSADDIFYNGQIRPTYPLFDRNLLNGVVSVTTNGETETASVGAGRRRLPLRKLMLEERETVGSSCSSSTTSEADDDNNNNELNGVAAGTYCVWNPKTACKKSNSTGSSSRRWKLLDLLHRSHSDGKERQPLLFLGPTKRTNKLAHQVVPKPSAADHGGAGAATASQDHGDQTKRKSFLPYRQELVGLFSNVNGVGRNLQLF